MLEHPYITQVTIDQRYKRLQREADVWRLFHPKTERRRGGLLLVSGRALVRLGRRLVAYGVARPVPKAQG